MDEVPFSVCGRHILLVEDNFLIAEALRSGLESLGAIVVGPVGSVADALAIVESDRRLDDAILDVDLGGERSYAVASALLQRGTPVVFVTGYGSQELPEDLRGVPVLSKPVEPRDIVEVLASAGARS